MRLLSRASTPLEAWLHASAWYSQVARWKNIVLPEDEELQASIVALHDSLVAEAEALSEFYGLGTDAVDKRIVEVLPLAVLEIESQAGELFEGVGGLGAVGLLARFKKYKKLGPKAWKYGKWLLVAFGLIKLGPPAVKLGSNILDAFNRILETDAEKALRIRGNDAHDRRGPQQGDPGLPRRDRPVGQGGVPGRDEGGVRRGDAVHRLRPPRHSRRNVDRWYRRAVGRIRRIGDGPRVGGRMSDWAQDLMGWMVPPAKPAAAPKVQAAPAASKPEEKPSSPSYEDPEDAMAAAFGMVAGAVAESGARVSMPLPCGGCIEELAKSYGG